MVTMKSQQSLTNPSTILDFMALFTGLSIDMSGYKESLSFVGGTFLGSAAWWLFLASSIVLFKSRITHKQLAYINYIGGVIIFSFGLYALSSLWR